MNIDEKEAKLDKSNVIGSIGMIGKQIRQAFDEVSKIEIAKEYMDVKNVVVCGIGGSALGTDLVKSLFYRTLKVPVEIVNDYNLPGYVGKDSMILLSSYSGGTDETLSCARQAKKMGLKIVGITSGGELSNFLKENGCPRYVFEPKFNPCKQPRIGLGYSVFGQIALFARFGFVDIENEEINDLVEVLERSQEEFKEIAKNLAEEVCGKVVIYVSGEHLGGNGHILANQTNENSKQMAFNYLIPEANHHLMEGLRFPLTNKDDIFFLFLESDLYSDRIKKRFVITKEVVEKNGLKLSSLKRSNKTRLIEAMTVVSIGSYLTTYLGFVNEVNPAKIPWVDYFKKKLAS